LLQQLLEVISPADLQPMFETAAESAVRLCEVSTTRAFAAHSWYGSPFPPLEFLTSPPA
jgi:hypothetical protein